MTEIPMPFALTAPRRIAAGLVLLALLIAPSTASGQSGGRARGEVAAPVILSPADGATIPCPDTAPCFRVTVQGKTPTGYWPFLAVAPLAAAPRIWIQPPIVIVREDGTFSGTVYLGTTRNGGGEQFQLLILAHPDRTRFKEGEILTQIPDGVKIGDPVVVLRPR
jgi:hypothetical protein